MKKLIVLSLFVSAAIYLPAENLSLPRSTPEEQGISSAAILDFVEGADKLMSPGTNAIHSFMLVRHGQVVAEGWWSPYNAETRHKMFSLSKSFTSTAVGLAITEGKLSLDDSVLSFFPEDAPSQPSENLKAMRVRDLLIMSCGQNSNTVAQVGDVMKNLWHTNLTLTKAFLAAPVEVKPGTIFVYNTPGSYMLSAIVQKVTGQTVFDFLKPRLFQPLGIDDATWDTSPQGISMGGIGLNICTEDIAKFGQLYLHKGNWNGKQLVPASWVEMATARQTSNGSNPDSDWDQGYGYHFWRTRHGLYRADGLYGQFCIVMPQQDAVLAITCGTRDMASVMNLVWDKLLPAMQTSPLPPNEEARKKLQSRLAGLNLSRPQGPAANAVAAQVSGKTYLFPTNHYNIESAKLEFKGPEATLVVFSHGKEHNISIGNSVWKNGRTDFVAGADWRVVNAGEQSVAASGAWTANDTYMARLSYYETPLTVSLNFRFAGSHVVLLNMDYSVVIGEMTSGQIVGEAK